MKTLFKSVVDYSEDKWAQRFHFQYTNTRSKDFKERRRFKLEIRMKNVQLATIITYHRENLGRIQNLYYRKVLITQTSIMKGLVYVIFLEGQK